jgi:transcriptional regulator with XRE-family HTH domain
MKDILKHIGAQVRSLRGWRSQEEFARKVGLPKSRISPIEQGQANITLKTLAQIAARGGGKLRIEIEKPS